MVRELTREEKGKIRALVTKWCANYDREYGCLSTDYRLFLLLQHKHPITKPLLHNDLAFAMLRRFETLYFKPPFSALKIGIRGAC